MSFAKLSYDTCAYEKQLQESLDVGKYQIQTPIISNDDQFFTSPYIRLDKSQVATCKNMALIDVDSELLGLNMKNSKCPKKRGIDSQFCENTKLKDVNNSFMSPEDTRFSNPACTLRGTGWNRWEWLCENPQKYAITPFQTDINNRMVVKDNHRPCLPNLSSVDKVLPNNKDDSCYTDREIKNMYKETPAIPFVHWRSCDEIRKL